MSEWNDAELEKLLAGMTPEQIDHATPHFNNPLCEAAVRLIGKGTERDMLEACYALLALVLGANEPEQVERWMQSVHPLLRDLQSRNLSAGQVTVIAMQIVLGLRDSLDRFIEHERSPTRGSWTRGGA